MTFVTHSKGPKSLTSRNDDNYKSVYTLAMKRGLPDMCANRSVCEEEQAAAGFKIICSADLSLGGHIIVLY